jgi:hypothetical protein
MHLSRPGEPVARNTELETSQCHSILPEMLPTNAGLSEMVLPTEYDDPGDVPQQEAQTSSA